MSYVVGLVSSISQVIFERCEGISMQHPPKYRAMKQENTDPSITIMDSG